MHPATVESDMPAYAQSLFAWARRRGYRWVGDECRITTEGRELSPNDFLPRRLMGEWLNWSYHALVAVCPGQVSVRHHATSAVDIEAVDGRELVHLADGRTLLVDQVILTTGHTPDHPRQGDESRPLSPYPVDNFRELIGPDDTVAIAGLGLVALDVVAALTVGLGGTFHECDGRLRYQGSGKEPKLFLFSRSGQPYFAKPTGASDPTGEYVPVICTPDAAARLRTSEDGRSARGAVDFCQISCPLSQRRCRYDTTVRAQPCSTRIRRQPTRSRGRSRTPGPRANSQLSWKNMLAGTALSISNATCSENLRVSQVRQRTNTSVRSTPPSSRM